MAALNFGGLQETRTQTLHVLSQKFNPSRITAINKNLVYRANLSRIITRPSRIFNKNLGLLSEFVTDLS